MYGEAATAGSRHTLATEVWRCRQLLGAEALVNGPDGYRLDSGVVAVDVVDFERGLADAREALDRGDLPAAARGFETALALWRGEPLLDWRDSRSGLAAVASLQEL